MGTYDVEADVLVVGSGAAGMVAALKAKEEGLEPILIESTELLGGNSAISGGGVWIPNNHVIKRAGQTDSYEEAREYLDLCVGDVGPASSSERRHAYLTEGPAMVQWLEDLGFKWVFGKGYSDYYPERPGGKPMGRGIEGKKYNINRLGKWKDKLRFSVRAMPMYTSEVNKMAVSFRTWKGFFTAARVIGLEATFPRLIGKHLVGLGNSLMGQMLEMLLARKVAIWLSTPMKELILDGNRVLGLVVESEGKLMRVKARKGVILASGGFERNAKMRETYQEQPITDQWTSGTEGNLGRPIELAHQAGAALALMEDAWWGPTLMYPDSEQPQFMLHERSLPFCFIVAEDGKRFMNESESYVDAGHHQYERHRTVKAIPAWQIMDSRHRKYYPFGTCMPGKSGSKKGVESGLLVTADTIEVLAEKIGVNVEGLVETTRRFNEFAKTGKDLDFHRGDSAYDRVYSDPRVKPNPNLGSVENPPFFAAKVYPGDLGTKGGMLTDEYARVIHQDGSLFEGLYASGNCSASVMGHTYPGPGSTLGPALTFGYIAGQHIAKRS
ncbi:MAG: FAD-binding protein [Deltaproteobacteria bacterium]|nr:MAG: FAD-binding protein [Deltaproteobacteria bacterium]